MNEHDAIEQLAALLDGDIDASAAPTSLTSLATLAETVRDQADLMAPTAEFRASLREELLGAAEPAPGLVERARLAWSARTANLRHSARVAVATMTASSMIGSAGVAVAAQEALPGDALYGLKGVTEDARLLLATSDVAQARLHLAFARERLLELQASANRLSADQAVALLAEMDAHSQSGAQALIDGITAGTVDPAEVRDFATGQRDVLVLLLGDLPLLAKPVAEDSLELLRRIEITASGISPVADCDCDRTAAAPPAPSDTRVDTTPAPLMPVETVIAAPGDGPALLDVDCDCVELPGGPAAREPTRDDTAGEQPEAETDQEPEQEPFQPTGDLADPKTSNGDDDDEQRAGFDLPVSNEDVPLDQSATLLEDTSGADVDTGPLDRATDSLLP